jgi:lysophospholipid acyltransferase (LPLAT)-like uncharacterized protein
VPLRFSWRLALASRDARGDCVALFCRWLGFEVVRGDAEHGGREALIEIANEVREGAAALISPDGGPPFVARVGAIALASAVGVPLILVGADCSPSVFERHKWDDARNPLPYGRIEWLAVNHSPSGRLKTPRHSRTPAANYKMRSTGPPTRREAHLVLAP